MESLISAAINVGRIDESPISSATGGEIANTAAPVSPPPAAGAVITASPTGGSGLYQLSLLKFIQRWCTSLNTAAPVVMNESNYQSIAGGHKGKPSHLFGFNLFLFNLNFNLNKKMGIICLLNEIIC